MKALDVATGLGDQPAAHSGVLREGHDRVKSLEERCAMTSCDPAPGRRSLLVATLLCAAALALPGCGGSASRSTTVGQASGSTSGSTSPITGGGGPSATGKQSPCGPISAKQAQAITGETLVSKTVAPLGPTCIFKFHGRLSTVTLVVEGAAIQTFVRQMRRPERVDVAGLPAYCGTLGSTVLFVALPKGGVLSVTAPCPIAQAFAAQALASP